MYARAWRVPGGDGEDICYRLQIDNVPVKKRLRKEINNLMEGWSLAAEGLDSNRTNALLVFRKSFKKRYDWLAWARQFPYRLSECSDKSNQVKILSVGTEKRKTAKKLRTCSYCGETGHNKRRCDSLKKKVRQSC